MAYIPTEFQHVGEREWQKSYIALGLQPTPRPPQTMTFGRISATAYPIGLLDRLKGMCFYPSLEGRMLKSIYTSEDGSVASSLPSLPPTPSLSFQQTQMTRGDSDSPSKHRLPCRRCSKIFSTVSSRNEHERSGCKLAPEKIYQCRHCGRCYKKKWNCKNHEKRWCPRNRT